MFEKGTREKVRFPYKGISTIEDLWDISVQELDNLHKQLNSKLKVIKEESLLKVKSAEDATLMLQINIIKRIVEVKLQEQDERITAAAKSIERKRLLAIKASKEETEILGKSSEEIQKMIDDLDKE